MNHPNQSSPTLEVRNLSIALPDGADRPFAVERVSFTVSPHQTVCLVGESGSGKSAVAHAVMGLLPKGLAAVHGQILLNGEDVLRAGQTRLRELRCTRMSMIFQEPMTALNPVLTCGDQIDEVLRAHTSMSPGARRRRVLEIIEKVRLPDPERIFRAYPHQLSGGQRQRIMIAMALVLGPALLIADEPTTALDVTTQAQILGLIRELQQEHGTGVLFITHDFGVVAEITDHVAVLRLGDMVESRPTKALLSDPRHDYTKSLIAAVPSLIPGPRRPIREDKVTLRTQGLGKTYPRSRVPAASNVTLEIRRGETLGIVGESGSGKSTVARCIARLISPDAGSILLNGQDVAWLSTKKIRPLRRSIQIVFQDPYRSLNPRRRVGDSIIEGPMNYGMPRSEAWTRAGELMELVRLDPAVLTRFPHEFSGGQRQRICIARALAMEPELLIADEAVSALDVSVQAQVLTLFEEIRDRMNLAMLFITHDLRVAARVCDRIAVMSRGEIVECGATADVFAAPRHDYTRTLFAAAPGRGWNFNTA